MAQYNNIDDLGNAIEAIIDQAVSSQNFQKLNQTICQTVNAVVNTGSEAVRRVTDETAKRNSARKNVIDARRDTPLHMPNQGGSPSQTVKTDRGIQYNVNIYSSQLGSTRPVSQPKSSLPALYQNTTGKLVGGILKTVGGGILTLGSFGCLLASVIVALVVGSWIPVMTGLVSAAFLAGSASLLSSGIRTIGRVGRFQKYVRALGQKTHCEIQRLARLVGKPTKFVRKELQRMIDEGYFLEGHLDNDQQSLITSDDTFVHYLQTQRQQAVQKQQEVVNTIQQQKEREEQKQDAQLQEVLDKGNAFLRQIRSCNDAIRGAEISEKISRMETIVEKIFDRAKAHPEIVPDLKKLMAYYLPMTVKLLNAYAEMEAQPIQGQTIQASRQEIEATLDTLNNAFEKLLDSIFKDTALDVSSDISVLQTLLAQEGLTDDFPQMK